MLITKVSSPNFSKGRNGYKPEIIVIHIMAGSLSGTDSWFSSSKSQVSSHYGVGLNAEVHQYVDESNQAWTQGYVNNPTFKLYKPRVNPNRYCISIEHEGFDLSTAPQVQLDASVELIKDIAKRNNIPIDRDHIIGHYEIDKTRKPNCPATDKSILDKLVNLAQDIPPPQKEVTLGRIEELIRQLRELIISLCK